MNNLDVNFLSSVGILRVWCTDFNIGEGGKFSAIFSGEGNDFKALCIDCREIPK